MEDGEAPSDEAKSATETATASTEETLVTEGEDAVKMEIKAEDDIVKDEDIGDEIIEMGDLKEHYDQDVQVGNTGSMYRVTLVLVKDQINLPGPDDADGWCNLPYESLRALDSATLAFVRFLSTRVRTDVRCVRCLSVRYPLNWFSFITFVILYDSVIISLSFPTISRLTSSPLLPLKRLHSPFSTFSS